MRFTGSGLIAVLAAAAALSACGRGKQPDYALSCMFEVNAPGAYEYPAGTAAPHAVPGEGGTAEGAAALNACIQRKAAAAGQTAVRTRRATVETESVSGGGFTVVNYTYGTPPAQGRSAGGSLPLPSGYVLMPGDAQLWPQLTPAEQQRALQYLQDGSTIRSSLRAGG